MNNFDHQSSTQQDYLSEQANFPSKVIIATLFIGAFFGYLNDTLLNVALTDIMADFNISKTTVQWLTTGFLLVMGAFTPITANLIQWLETRKMVLITQAIFLLGSLICLCAPNFAILLFGRLFQAIAAAFFVPILFNAILVIFPPNRRGTAMGLIAMMFTAAPAIGPTISGIIIDYSHWRYLFALTIPFMLVAMLLVNRYLTVNLTPITRPKIDIPSAMSAILGFGGLVFVSSHFHHFSMMQSMLIFAVSITIIYYFCYRQFQLTTPLLDLRAFQFHQFRYAILILAIAYFLFMGMELLMPMYTQQVLALSGVITGMILMPASIAQAIASPLLGTLLDQKGGRFLIIPATLLLLFSLALMWIYLDLETNTLLLTVLFTLMATAVTACITGETHGLNALPRTLNPHGASIIATLNPIAGALGAAFFVGVTNIGEQFSSTAHVAQAMLNGVHLTMACAVLISLVAVVFAFKIK